MINKINKAMLSGKFSKRFYRKISKTFNKVTRKLDLWLQSIAFKSFSKDILIENNKIMFIPFQGSYTCNPKAIANEIIKQGLPYQLVWVVFPENMKDEKELSEFPSQIKLVTRGSYDFFKEAASSKIWIDNALNMKYLNVTKKKDQILFQTWHGSMGLKRIGLNDVSNKRWLKKALKYGKETDFCISNSDFETEVYKSTYWANNTILEYGHPRNDILFSDIDKQKEIDDKVRTFLDISSDKKIFLYAPTFRDSSDTEIFDLNYSEIVNSLSKRFGGEWVVLTRFHFKQKNKFEIDEKYKDVVVDASKYFDIQELIVVSDVALTDYSSWICDWVVTKKPGFLYTPDIENYNQERGFYYPLSETPFPIAESFEKLLDNIEKFDEKKYERKRKVFLKKRGCYENGDASYQVVQKIKEIIENSNI